MIGKLRRKCSFSLWPVRAPSVDCFANYYNYKFGTPILRMLIFFFQSLRGENCLVVLHFLKSQQAVGTLVVPLWPSAHFWLLLTHKYSSYLVAHSSHIGEEVLTRGRKP